MRCIVYIIFIFHTGDLELTANAGKAELQIRINGTKFDDGALHTVRLVRAHKQVRCSLYLY